MRTSSKSRISVCMVVRDELPFLKKSMPLISKWSDQVVVIDAGSTDGSLKYLQMFLDPVVDVILTAPKDTIPKYGFSYLRNMAAERATGNWIHALDADEMLSFEQHELIHDVLDKALVTNHEVVSVKTITFDRQDKYTSTDWEGIASSCPSHEDRHRRIYRNDGSKSIQWRGYIHEELYKGDRNCFGMHIDSDLKHLHYSAYRDWVDPNLKDRRYCWMLLNAYENPELRRWTNGWWYQIYVPENLEKIKRLAGEYVAAGYDRVETM